MVNIDRRVLIAKLMEVRGHVVKRLHVWSVAIEQDNIITDHHGKTGYLWEYSTYLPDFTVIKKHNPHTLYNSSQEKFSISQCCSNGTVSAQFTTIAAL